MKTSGRDKKIPVRRCVVCAGYKSRDVLYRLAQLKSRAIIWEEEGGKRPQGKGIYICREGICLLRFVTEKKFRKRFHEKMNANDLSLLQKMGSAVKSEKVPINE